MGYQTLIDAGPIIAYYSLNDAWHARVQKFFEEFTGQFITTCPVITEAMWILSRNVLAQNEMLSDFAEGLYQVAPLTQRDFVRIAELNVKYRSMKADFADLSLIAVSERLSISRIASLDGDFDVYRRIRKQKFERIFP
jgi:uncharacterized protein